MPLKTANVGWPIQPLNCYFKEYTCVNLCTLMINISIYIEENRNKTVIFNLHYKKIFIIDLKKLKFLLHNFYLIDIFAIRKLMGKNELM